MIFRNRVILVLVIGLAIMSVAGIGILVTHISWTNDDAYMTNYFNKTQILILRYETIPGTCTYCYASIPPDSMIGPDPPSCYDYDGFFAYAVVNYEVWIKGPPNTTYTIYTGNSPKDMWCAGLPDAAISLAESKYGVVGQLKNGYYYTKNPSIWRFHLPGHMFYLGLMDILVFVGLAALVSTLSLLAYMFYRRRKEQQTYDAIVVNGE